MGFFNFNTVSRDTSAGLDRLAYHSKLENSISDIHNELHIHLLTQIYCVIRKSHAGHYWN